MAATPIMEPQAAIIHYTRYLAQDLGSFGITANCIAPGVIVSTACHRGA
jgi:NAD(P)-dependent dehydrogenase (short-subunit alcohol dehydrogenase family)